jgi:hypothetical protein
MKVEYHLRKHPPEFNFHPKRHAVLLIQILKGCCPFCLFLPHHWQGKFIFYLCELKPLKISDLQE